MEKAELQRRFEEVLADTTEGSGTHDYPLRRTVAALGLSVLKLDTSSALLARVNIGIGVILVLIGALQAWIMIRGH
ncbi:MAG: hypothetical protein LAO03_02365 [Acidobacteriia bacterium]|nr:hypothetical protein [Terriglobia bacterium]